MTTKEIDLAKRIKATEDLKRIKNAKTFNEVEDILAGWDKDTYLWAVRTGWGLITETRKMLIDEPTTTKVML